MRVFMLFYILMEGDMLASHIRWEGRVLMCEMLYMEDGRVLDYVKGEAPARFPLPVPETVNALAVSYKQVMPVVKGMILARLGQ